MLRRIARAWRVLATGALIAVFAGSVLAAALVLLPWLRLTERDPLARRRRMRRAARRLAERVVGAAERLGVLRVRVEGAGRLRGPGKLVVANHPTLFDALVLLRLLDDAAVVAGRRRWDKPLIRPLLPSAGFPLEEGPGLVDDCVEQLEQGASLVMFLEGTRSVRGALQPFRRGAAHVALRTGRPLVPVVLTCEPPFFSKDAPWYRASDRPHEIRVRVEEPIGVEDPIASGLPQPAAARQLTAHLRELFEKHLERART
jgi:1-acyl-sn-glycerol-3-phosphate acyltransferase